MVNDIGILLYQSSDHVHYSPGSEVEGAVVVTVDKPKEYTSIIVKLFGRAEVSWSERRGSGNNSYSVHYDRVVPYIEEETVVWSREEAPSGELPVGKHTFPFQYQLPQNIPRSFDGYSGKVEYEITAEIKSGARKSNVTKAILMVKENTDLLEPFMEAKTFDKDTTVKFLCYNFGSMSMRCTMPCMYWVHGWRCYTNKRAH